MTDLGNVTFEQGGVLVGNSGDRERDMLCTGQLQIREYSPEIAYVEWKPSSEGKTISMESNKASDLDWAIVNTTIGYKVEQGDATVQFVNGMSPVLPVHIAVNELKTLKIGRNQQHLVIVEKDGSTTPAFLFSKGNAEGFICALKRYVTVQKSRKDRNVYNVTPLNPDNLFTLDDVPQASSTWHHKSPQSAVYNLITKPSYESALHTFSKVYEYAVYGFQQTYPSEEIADLQRSLSLSDSGSIEQAFKATSEDNIAGIQKFNCVKYPLTKSRREEPLTPAQWGMHLMEDGTVREVESLKSTISKGGVHPSMRPEVWKFLLGYYSYDQTSAERELHRQKCTDKYYQMKLQWRSITEDQESRFMAFRDRKSIVEKDVLRTDRTHAFYNGDTNPNVQTLNDILMTYVMYNFDLGYVQGMSDLLSPILVIMRDEVDAFWCFKGFMDRIALNFEFSQMFIKEELTKLYSLIQLTDPQLCSYLEDHESGNLFFCFRWLLVWFKRDFAFGEIMRLWEILWTSLPCPGFHLFCILANLHNERNSLMQSGFGFTEILKYVNEMAMKIDLNQMLSTAESLYQRLMSSSEDLPANIRTTLGLEPLENHQDGDSTPTSPHGLNISPGCVDSNEDTSSIEVISGDDEERDYEFAMMFQM